MSWKALAFHSERHRDPRGWCNAEAPVVIVVLWFFRTLPVLSLVNVRPFQSHCVWNDMFDDECFIAEQNKYILSFENVPFIVQMKGNYTFFVLFILAFLVPLTFLSTWLTIYSYLRVGEHISLEVDWWQHFMCTGFSVSIGWCANTVSLHVRSLLYVFSAVSKSTSSNCIWRRGRVIVSRELGIRRYRAAVGGHTKTQFPYCFYGCNGKYLVITNVSVGGKIIARFLSALGLTSVPQKQQLTGGM